MKKTKLLVLSPLVLLFTLLWASPQHFFPTLSPSAADDSAIHQKTKQPVSPPAAVPRRELKESDPDSERIVSYAMSLRGAPYLYAGITPEGFDCSGFITHVFDRFGIAVPHSSAMQAEEGIYVDRAKASPGDLVIFTGTDADVREPGHAGIVISSPGDTIEFVHSSSNGGVKVSKVEGSRYDLRFLQVRRIL